LAYNSTRRQAIAQDNLKINILRGLLGQKFTRRLIETPTKIRSAYVLLATGGQGANIIQTEGVYQLLEITLKVDGITNSIPGSSMIGA
jgi:hypothetical protein